MKPLTRLFLFAILPAMLVAIPTRAEVVPNATAPGQPLTGTSSLPAASAVAVVGSTPNAAWAVDEKSLIADDDESSGLADARLRAAKNAPVLTIEDVLALALQDNPQRKAAWAAVEAARARIKTAKSAGGPQVNLSAGASTQRAYGSTGDSTFRPAGFGALPGGGPYNSETASINATLPIYTGGKVSASKRVAQFSAQAQEAQARSVEQDLVFNTAIAYLNVLRGQQLLEVGNANLGVARERRHVSQVRFDAGAAAHLEVSRAETDLANARQNRIAASNALGRSLSALNTLMGRAPSEPLRLEPIANWTLPKEILATNDAGVVISAPSEQLQLAANQGRQSLAVTNAQINSTEASVDLARAAKRPSIGLDILGLIRNPVTFAGRFLISLGGNLAQNLFDSGRTRAQVHEAQAVLQQLQFRRTGEEQAIANDIEQSLLLLDSAQKRLATSDTGIVSARDALSSAQLGYEAGASTSLEVSDAQAALLTAETDAVNARFDVAAAQARLSAATGVLPEEAKTAYKTLAVKMPTKD